jgi:glycosyltransferase involved in cell wall biosynthesis
LFTSAFPYGVREEFLEDELPILAARCARVTVVCEDASGPPRSIPANCDVVTVPCHDAPPRWSVLPQALKALAGDRHRGRGVRRQLHALRSIAYYLRRASALKAAVNKHLTGGGASLPICFYSYWMDYKALAAGQLAQQHSSSFAVSRGHGHDLYADRHPFGYLPLRHLIGSRLKAVFAVSEVGAAALRKQLPADTSIVTARLGVPAAIASARCASPADDCLVLSIGSLIPLKRVRLLIAALERFGLDDRISWEHYGGGPLRDDLAREAAARLRIPHILRGYVPHLLLRQILADHAPRAVVVSTSSSEGIPVSLMEAMAAGIPCIATRVGGTAEIVDDGVNGYLLAADPSPSEVAGAIKRYRELPAAEKLALRQAAVRTWAVRFDASTNYGGFASRLASMVRAS